MPTDLERAGLFVGAGADLEGPYRYSLFRERLAPHGARVPSVCWIMLNPSTADAAQLDPTLRRCAGFTEAWGFGRFDVVNLFAWRSTSPAGLLAAADPIGPRNDAVILKHALRARLVLVAWGSGGPARGLVPARAAAVGAQLRALGVGVACLGTNADGAPAHPLYLPASAAPRAFPGES